MTGELLRVMVCPPGSAGWDTSARAAAWQDLGFQHAPDFAAAQSQHEILCRLLGESGAEVVSLPAGKSLTTNGDGEPVDISGSSTRTFLGLLTITEQLEQESLDVSICGSADGQDFGKKPLLKLPQQFYIGVTKMVLDVSLRPEVRFLRAKWEVNRWGRVSPLPMFVAGFALEEIPPMSRDLPTKRAVLASR